MTAYYFIVLRYMTYFAPSAKVSIWVVRGHLLTSEGVRHVIVS